MKCQCCGSEMLVLGQLGAFAQMRCQSCQFEHFVAERDSIASEMYEHDVDYKDDLVLSKSHRSLIQWAHKRALLALKKAGGCSPARTRVLDVGCFNGFFVKELVMRGYDAHGIDFNRDAVEFGKRCYGLGDRLRRQSLQELGLSGEKFDVVTMFEVIEHLPSPEDMLGEVLRVLKPGGLLVVSTPNSKMCWRPPLDFPPHHLSRFTPLALELLLRRSGLSFLGGEEQMSLYDLIRHRSGLLLRRRGGSLRGGEFRSHQVSIGLRRLANAARSVVNFVFLPIDWAAHALGFRYISQVAVARL